MPTPLHVLLVMPAGAARRGARSALVEAGFTVRSTPEPYAATLALAEAPADLVVLDLGTFRRRDAAFLKAVRRRAPATRVLLLLPEGARRAALHALAAGADAYVLDPFRAEELCAVARGLLRERLDPQSADPEAVRRLAAEVAHAINNPLQVLSLSAEAAGSAKAPAEPGSREPGLKEPGLREPGLREPVARIRDVVALLSGYGSLSAPVRRPTDLAPLLAAVLEAAVKAGQVRVDGALPTTGLEASADAAQVREALRVAVAALASRSPTQPLALSARVVRSRGRHATAGLQLLARGLSLPPAEHQALPGSVLSSHEQSRRALPGLALPAAVARLHGGSLRLKAGRQGLVVTLRFGP